MVFLQLYVHHHLIQQFARFPAQNCKHYPPSLRHLFFIDFNDFHSYLVAPYFILIGLFARFPAQNCEHPPIYQNRPDNA